MIKLSYEEYKKMSSEDKLTNFLGSLKTIALPADYWINFNKVQDISEEFGPEFYTLDYLIGKTEKEIDLFFQKNPSLLKLIPTLLGIRDSKLSKINGEFFLDVFSKEGDYALNFSTIDESIVNKYIEFMKNSGLYWVFTKGVSKSIHDYSVGVETGMDSNGRKNRSGKLGEIYIEAILKDIAKQNNFEWNGQTTYSYIKNEYGIDLDTSLKNVRFDGSLFDPKNKKLYLFEINNFSSGGSKLKAMGGEFSLRQQIFSDSNHELVYITDGQGWIQEKSHLLSILSSMNNVFNFYMVQNNFIQELINTK